MDLVVFKICPFCINTGFPATLPITEGSLERRNWNALQLPHHGLLNGLDQAVVPSFMILFRRGEESEGVTSGLWGSWGSCVMPCLVTKSMTAKAHCRDGASMIR